MNWTSGKGEILSDKGDHVDVSHNHKLYVPFSRVGS